MNVSVPVATVTCGKINTLPSCEVLPTVVGVCATAGAANSATANAAVVIVIFIFHSSWCLKRLNATESTLVSLLVHANCANSPRQRWYP